MICRPKISFEKCLLFIRLRIEINIIFRQFYCKKGVTFFLWILWRDFNNSLLGKHAALLTILENRSSMQKFKSRYISLCSFGQPYYNLKVQIILDYSKVRPPGCYKFIVVENTNNFCVTNKNWITVFIVLTMLPLLYF